MKPIKLFTTAALCMVLVTPSANAAKKTSLAELFETVDPAVVEIATIQIATIQEEIADDGPATRTRAGGLGSGFLISSDGTIMTAAHVVQMAEDVAVRWVNGEVSKAAIISTNRNADIAIIRAESVPETINPLILADSDAVRIGDEVFIIGTPMTYAHSLTVGHVSARRTPSISAANLPCIEPEVSSTNNQSRPSVMGARSMWLPIHCGRAF